MNEPYLIEGAVPQSLANLIRESKGEPATTKYLPAQFYSELRTIINSGRYLIKRASGAIASFNDAVAAPLVGLRVALPWRSGGYDAVEVTRCGKNLFGGNALKNKFVELGGSVNLTNKSVTISGNAISGKHFFEIPFSEGAYSIVLLKTAAAAAQQYSNFHWRYTNNISAGANGPNNEQYLTISNSQYTIDYFFGANNTGGAGVTFFYESCGVFRGEITLDEFEPYNGDTYTITLPTTIYGGYLDAVTGQLVATHDENGNLLTNQKLYFLPPTNVFALAGVNNVWSDAGDVAVSYRVE